MSTSQWAANRGTASQVAEQPAPGRERLWLVPDLLDDPDEHPIGPVWIRLDRRGIQLEQARSVWSRPVRR